MAELEQYLAVLKASYDYEPQSEDEVKIQEDQILFLLERTDDDWWKVKVKGASPDEEGPSGLVPAAYVEPAPHTTVVKAQYEYAAQANGEISIAEDQMLHAFGAEEDGWLLVQTEDGSQAGYVPANYVEEAGEGAAEAEEEAPAAAPSFANIVIPDSPQRPVSAYHDPADLVASSRSARPAQAPDPVQTWSVSEVDKKGKKKKGTLGVGNGTVFFASESDKAPVQQVQLAQVSDWRLDENKPKHLYISLNGQETHFNCGDRDTAEDILYKLKKSRKAAGLDEDEAAAAPEASTSPARTRGVHFAESGPAVIPASPEPEEDDEPTPTHTNGHAHAADDEDDEDGEPAIALYDFQAAGEDELSVDEGDKIWIVERDSEEWWKVRDTKGNEGVVPASYIEPTGPPRAAKAKAAAAPVPDDDSEDERAAEAEREAAAAAAARAAERKAKQEAEERKQRERAKREAERERAAAEEERRAKEKERERRAKEKEAAHKSKGSIDKRGPPPADKTRVWTDRTGQFRVEAAFLGYKNGMIRLHKVNGVVIEVPSEKMSIEDIAYIDKATNPRKRERNSEEDDEPLANRRQSLISGPSASSSSSSVNKAAPQQAPPKKKGPGIDWFEFFLNSGCDIDDCTRYAASFERDKIDAALLPDITESTMRSLGLREGDIIRVRKAIADRGPPKPEKDKRDDSDQIKQDEAIARALQEGREIPKRSTPSPGAPNLFTTAGGQLKNNTRRGRPTKSSTIPNAVGLDGLSTASETIARGSTPQLVGSPSAASPVQQLPPRTSSVATPPVSSGFDDDAWTNRPSSTKPMTPTPNAQPTRAPSAPPAPAPPPAPAAPTPPPAPPAPSIAQRSVSAAPAQQQKGLSQTTESDIFDQLARLSQLRVASPAAPPAAPTPPVASPPPAGYAAGLGVGSSPSPLGAHLQAQATGALPPLNGPRGPLAPVPQNQGLLQPLVPTQTGFRGFVPTTSPGLQPQPTGFQPQPTGFQPQPTGFQPQPTGFNPSPGGLQPQPTGFNPSPFQPQPTGFQPQGFQPQPTGFQPQQTGFQPQQTGFQPQLQPQPTGFNPGFGVSQSPPPVPPLPSFAQQGNFGLGGGIQPQPTGFNPGFGQPPPKDTSPANVFAQMKAGTFGDDSAPQGANKYDALRTNTTPLTAQPTGWGGYGAGGFQGGYNGYQG
ncbi:unnamed protein product [Peniophora sp. CBMAI 1063]|nr:unnamed protein product [Peniophora sp. CBMAI 1063]